MNRPTNFTPYRFGSPHAKTAKGAADFLQANDALSSLLPAVTRLAALQKDCSILLPAVFDICSVMHFDAGQLVLATPSAALAARLKQQLPKLQEGLLKRGWQVNAIRIKLQVTRPPTRATPSKQLVLPNQALSSLSTLGDTLEDTPRNQALKTAILTMVQRHRAIK